MPQQLLSPEEFDAIASTTTTRARELAKQVDLLASQRLELGREARRVLKGRTHRLSSQADRPRSELAGCTAVLLPQGSAVDGPLSVLVRYAQWNQLAAPLLQHTDVLQAALKDALAAVRPRRGAGLLRRRHPADVPPEAVDRLRELEHWADATGFRAHLTHVLDQNELQTTVEQAPRIAAPFAYALGLPVPASDQPVLQAAEVRALRSAMEGGSSLQAKRAELVEEIKSAYEAVRDRMIARRLSDLPVSVIADVSKGSLRVGALERAGLSTVADVLDDAASLAYVYGVGVHTATQVVAIARTLRREIKEDLRLRIDLDESDEILTRLVGSLHLLLALDARVDEFRDQLDQLLSLLAPLKELPQGDGSVLLLHESSPRRGGDLTRHLQERLAWIRGSGLAEVLGEAKARGAGGGVAWDDYKRRSVEYHALLAELLGITVDVEAAQGHLPREVVAAVHEQDLDSTALRVSLRGYQAFGARYTLVQRRVLIGDEMGLGKTIQALAVMAHLSANGAAHFVVVCPAAVLFNWMKEVRKHSRLEPVRIHGPERDRAWRQWRHRGGVAVTTYETMWRLDLSGVSPDLLVVDEAHYVKNPSARRSVAVSTLTERSDRTMFLTGTPLENNVQEFQNLVGYLQPEIAHRLDGASMVLGARKFREAVAPVYLRRNSEDVLTELPDLVETEEWVEFTEHEEESYLEALGAGQFNEMRRVAFTADPASSSKLSRLASIADEALANGHSVVVFSQFLDVLGAVERKLGSRVVGVIQGSLAPDRRQALVDRFSESGVPGVLLCQIVAGGVGLNLQAASVVVLCEPQVKPSLEDQAVKRAHRMGQVRTVQVHRLLTPESVDERLLEILGRKSEIFAQYAAQSEVAAASPEAVDVTDSAVAKRVLAQEQERYAARLRERMGAANASAGTRVLESGDTTDDVADEALDGPALEPEIRTAGITPVVSEQPAFTRVRCGACGIPIDPVRSLCGCS